MNVLICGSSGLVGKELSHLLEDKNINFYGTYNSNKLNGPNMFKLDFSNTEEIKSFLIKKQINICVFTIVQRLTDICEKQWNSIKKVNIDYVDTTSKICSELKIKFIHISTDYVFDGFKQPNYPNDNKNPLQNYGISKLISEYRVIKNCKDYCIIRTPVLYSSLSKLHNNAVTVLGKKVMNLTENNECLEDNYNIRRPVYIKDLCFFILDCFKKSGIYHFYNPINKFTKYQMTKIISQYLNIDISNIKPKDSIDSNIAPRPYDTQLQDTKYNISDYKFTDFNSSIIDCFKKYKHPSIKENKNHFFYMIDLDDTIIQSSLAHFNAYNCVFKKYNKKILTIEEWEKLKNCGEVNNYLNDITNNDKQLFTKFKEEKISELEKQQIYFTKNSDNFIKYLTKNNINFCIVTNTNKKTVEIFKKKLPLLNNIKNWVCREDYNRPKPFPDSYNFAINKYYKNEKFKIGIEDSIVGFKSLKSVTNYIYIFNNKSLFKNEDCYLFDNYSIFYS